MTYLAHLTTTTLKLAQFVLSIMQTRYSLIDPHMMNVYLSFQASISPLSQFSKTEDRIDKCWQGQPDFILHCVLKIAWRKVILALANQNASFCHVTTVPHWDSAIFVFVRASLGFYNETHQVFLKPSDKINVMGLYRGVNSITLLMKMSMHLIIHQAVISSDGYLDIYEQNM